MKTTFSNLAGGAFGTNFVQQLHKVAKNNKNSKKRRRARGRGRQATERSAGPLSRHRSSAPCPPPPHLVLRNSRLCYSEFI